jgi:hypothetical protein
LKPSDCLIVADYVLDQCGAILLHLQTGKVDHIRADNLSTRCNSGSGKDDDHPQVMVLTHGSSNALVSVFGLSMSMAAILKAQRELSAAMNSRPSAAL